MDARMRRALALQFVRFVENLVRAQFLGRQHLLPQFCLLYVTHSCNARCGFCSREKEVKGGCPEQPCDLWQYREILVQIRKVTSNLYLTGGEPTTLTDLVERIRIARGMGFWPITMNTNGLLLHRQWDITTLLDKLVVSLHTVNPDKLAGIYQVKREMAERALANIATAALRAKIPGHAKVMANLVITPDNVGDADAVLDFCLDHEVELTVVPAIVGQRPLIELGGVEQLREYQRFLGRVIGQKLRDPRSIQGSLEYLRQIRRLEAVDCRPDVILPVSPDGHVLHACDMFFRKRMGRIDANTSVMSILESSRDMREKFVACPHRCLKVCYTQTALLYAQPMATAWDYLNSWVINN